MVSINSLIGIAIVAFLIFLLNMLLLFLAYRMRRFTRDVKYIIGLAISDSTPFIVVVCFFIILSIYKNNPDGIKRFRQAAGFLEMFWPSLSAQFTACLAMYRLAVIHGKKENIYLPLLSIISSIVLFIFLTIVAVNQELILSPSAFISQPYPGTSIISTITFYHIFLHIFICNLITIVGYSLVIYRVSKMNKPIKLENISHSGHHLHSQQGQQLKQHQIHHVTLKGILFIILSAFILIPGICIYFIEGYIIALEIISLKTKIILAVIKPSLFLVSGIINSLFVLFFHTGINKELKLLFSCNKKKLNTDSFQMD